MINLIFFSSYEAPGNKDIPENVRFQKRNTEMFYVKNEQFISMGVFKSQTFNCYANLSHSVRGKTAQWK